jgi:sec-independent protein translocase protein TatA
MYSSVFLFLNIGTPELILILFVALLLFGGNKLPELARGLGKGIRDFKDASEGVKREIHNQINNFDEQRPSSPAATQHAVTEAETEAPAAVATTETAEPHNTVKKEY